MKKGMFRKIVGATLLFVLQVVSGRSQTSPTPTMDQSYIPSSPNAQSFQSAGNSPVSLANGSQSINIPVYSIKCGSLTLPISLSYNYTGFLPLQDAGWVGLGWTLNAGGTISRIIQSQPDGVEPSGGNYDQMNLADSMQESPDYSAFLSSGDDLAPDIFACEFPGMSDQFVYYNGKAYQLDYDKRFNVVWSTTDNSMTVTTTDGTTYLFAATEITSAKTYQVTGDSTMLNYVSAWQLSQMVSADKKDTIVLHYAPYTWQQAPANYQSSYTLANQQGVYPDLGVGLGAYSANPSIQAQVLQSITCRTTRVSFIPDATLRTDVLGSYPRLAEIDVIDSLTGNLVKKNTLSYGYFGLTTSNPQNSEHLKLKTVAAWNTTANNDTLTYRFSYIGENSGMPQKGTMGIDDWGFYNGFDNNTSLLPASSDGYYAPKPIANFSSNNRSSNTGYSSLCALDTIVYPTGQRTVFNYTGTSFMNGGAVVPGPGICIASVLDYGSNASTPLQARYYSYNADATGQTSGNPVIPPSYNFSPFQEDFVGGPQVGVYPYYYYFSVYSANGNSSGIPTLFYFNEVTEEISSQNEIHKSSYYFNNYNKRFCDAQLTRKVDYKNVPGTNLFTPLKSVSSNFTFTQDTSFLFLTPFLNAEIVNYNQRPAESYTYVASQNTINTYWLRLVSRQSTVYDSTGNTLTTTANYNYSPSTRNMTSLQQSTSDGQTLTTKFKYPEDYVSALTGNMVTAGVLSPVLEKEVWLKKDAADSVLISGQVTQYDQTIFKPTATYALQTASPLPALNNETTSGGQYSSLLSTSQYALVNQTQYDTNADISTVNQASDIPMSYIWDYRHAAPIAQINNAVQADIAYTSFEADGKGNWVFSGSATADPTSPTGNDCYYAGQTGGISKSGLTPATTYVVSYWVKGTSALSIGGTLANYPIKGKTIDGWTYFEHEISGQSAISISGSSYIDELRLYPSTAQMKTYTYKPLIGKSGECDVDNRATYYQYDGFGRLNLILDQDRNIVKTYQYHYTGE